MKVGELGGPSDRRVGPTSVEQPTVGSVFRVATPLILSTLTWTVQTYVDRLFLSWHSVQAIAAVVPAGCLAWAIIGPLDALVGFANTLVAQYHGSRRPKGVGLAVAHALYLALIGGLGILLFAPLMPLAFQMASHEPGLVHLESAYAQIALLAGLPTLLGTAASCFFSGRGQTWTVLWVNALVTVVYLPLDYVLIFGWGSWEGLGIVGAAWATVLAAWIEAGLFVGLMLWVDRDNQHGTWQMFRCWEPRLLRVLIRYGGPEGAMVLTDLGAWTWFELAVGRLGVAALAATNMAFNVNSIVLFPLNGLSLAVTTLVAQQVGGGNRRGMIAVVKAALGPAAAVLAPVCLAFYLLPDLFLAPFAAGMVATDYAQLRDLAAVLLKFVAGYTMFDLCVNVFAGALRGVGDTRFVLLATAGTAILVLVLPSWLLARMEELTVIRLWALATAYIASLAVVFGLRLVTRRANDPIV